MAQHTVQTTHIQRLIRHGLDLAIMCDGETEHVTLAVEPGSTVFKPRPVEHALQKAAADLRHAAEELEAERLSVLGWPQV